MAEILGTATVVIRYDDGSQISVAQLVSLTDALYAQTKDLDFGAAGREKYIDLIVFDIEAFADIPGFTAQLGYRNNLKDDVVWLDEVEINPDSLTMTPRVTAKFFTLKIADSFPVTQWKLTRIEFYGAVMGGRTGV